MKTKNIQHFIILILFFVSSNLFAQDFLEWGNLSQEEINSTKYSPDPSANAVVLLDYGKMNIENENYFIFQRYKRIKILNRAGFESGDIKIPYLSEKEQIVACQAQITSPSGKTIKLTAKDFFTKKVTKWHSEHIFSFPNIEVGSIVEYKFEIKSERVATLKEWYFQGQLPIQKSKLELTLGPIFKYDFYTQGPLLDISTINKKEFSTDRNSPFYVHAYADMVNEYVFVRNNVPALQTLPFINNMYDHYERIKFRASQMPIGTKTVQWSHVNWHPSVNFLLDNNKFGWQYKTKGYYKDILKAVKPLIQQTKNKEAQLQIIYTYLLERINIVEKSTFLVEKSLNKSFNEQQASSDELNLMIVALVNNLKIGKAIPMAISTRSNGVMMEDYPFLDQFDHIMAYVEMSDKVMIVDAANSYLPIGYPAIESIHEKGLLIQPLSKWKEVSFPQSKNVLKGAFDLDETGTLIGEIAFTYEGFKGCRTREDFAQDPSGKQWNGKLADKYPDANLVKVDIPNLKEINEALQVTATLEIENIGQSNADYLYFNPLLYPIFEENPFKEVERNYNVDFPYPFKEQQDITINIPANFEITGIPESQKLQVDEFGSFEYTITAENKKISITYNFELKHASVSPANYKKLKDFFDILVEKTGALVTLKRKV